jgi:drug/metabolite transporter (DMT)-like permease
MQPVLVMVFFSRRFGETVGRTEWILSSVAIVGVALVVFGSSASPTWSPLGDFLACGALISWTMYFVNSKKARNTVSALEYQALSLWPSALIVLPIALAFSGTVDAGAGKWWWVPAMVAIPGSGHVFINWAHPRVPLGLISQMTLLSPVVAIALAAVLLTGESVNAAQITGMLIVLGALALLVRPSPTSTPAAD